MNELGIEHTDADPLVAALPGDAGGDQPRAWQEIENGRYQPRRIKGSCLGRELG